jgi:non-heme chloroperoxidase
MFLGWDCSAPFRGLMLRQLCILAALCIPAQSAPAPRPSHAITFVVTQPGVRVEVLDWGGHGPAMVFLAGFGNTGHVFDRLAPQFTDRHHVFAVTRRGFGASSRPVNGYDTGRLAQDILGVLDSFGIRRASFVGHSFAGSELSFLGAHHADRVAALIYLDASYDFAHLYADPRWQHAFPIPRPPAPTTADLSTLRRWLTGVMGPAVPDDEIRNLTSNGRGPALDTTLQQGAYPTVLADIKAPVLAFWAAPRTVKEWYPYWGSLDSLERAHLQSSFEDQMTVRREHMQTFREQVRGAQVVRLVGARHYLLLTHPRQVVDGMRAFLGSLEPRHRGR